MYSYGSPHMAAQKQDDQQERTFSSYVRIQVVVLKTCLGRWTIGRSGKRGSGISVLPARYDDDDDDIYIYIYIYIYVCVCVCVWLGSCSSIKDVWLNNNTLFVYIILFEPFQVSWELFRFYIGVGWWIYRNCPEFFRTFQRSSQGVVCKCKDFIKRFFRVL